MVVVLFFPSLFLHLLFCLPRLPCTCTMERLVHDDTSCCYISYKSVYGKTLNGFTRILYHFGSGCKVSQGQPLLLIISSSAHINPACCICSSQTDRLGSQFVFAQIEASVPSDWFEESVVDVSPRHPVMSVMLCHFGWRFEETKAPLLYLP
ncbi:hypothetical protein Mapa_001759 [Marchantia paleacea]|nr:hypothetical protein Mapa_001759 [Marchantia paleacea]